MSAFGTTLTAVALPLTALLVLDSSPLEQGVLQAASAAPVLVAGLFAGVLADRIRRRPIMIVADLLRAGLLTVVPILAWTGGLSIARLAFVAVLVAFCTAAFDAAYPAYLPGLVGRDGLLDANAKLAASASVAEAGGFAAAGTLVQTIGGPAALLVDAASFLVSAASLSRIRTPEERLEENEEQPSAWREALEGLQYVARDRALRALVGCATTMRLAGGVFAALYILFAVRDLGIPPAAAGIIAGCGGIGSLMGSASVRRALERFGAKRTLVVGFGLGGALQGLVPLAVGTPIVAGAMLLVAQIVGDAFLTVGAVVDASVRQTIVPERLLGRVSATANVLVAAALPVGALAGGAVGELASPRIALGIAAVVLSGSALWLIRVREAALGGITSAPTA